MSAIPGLPGLAVAGIFSGSLSTVSSAINSLAAVTLEVNKTVIDKHCIYNYPPWFQDYIRPCYEVPDSQLGILVKILALVFGVVCVALAFLADLLGTGVLQVEII